MLYKISNIKGKFTPTWLAECLSACGKITFYSASVVSCQDSKEMRCLYIHVVTVAWSNAQFYVKIHVVSDNTPEPKVRFHLNRPLYCKVL